MMSVIPPQYLFSFTLQETKTPETSRQSGINQSDAVSRIDLNQFFNTKESAEKEKLSKKEVEKNLRVIEELKQQGEEGLTIAFEKLLCLQWEYPEEKEFFVAMENLYDRPNQKSPPLEMETQLNEKSIVNSWINLNVTGSSMQQQVAEQNVSAANQFQTQDQQRRNQSLGKRKRETPHTQTLPTERSPANREVFKRPRVLASPINHQPSTNHRTAQFVHGESSITITRSDIHKVQDTIKRIFERAKLGDLAPLIALENELVHVEDNNGDTLLHNVVTGKQIRTSSVDILISKGANINHQNKLGNTPLHMAVMASCGRHIKTLLLRGASKKVTNREGLNPEQLANSSVKNKMINRIFQNTEMKETNVD
jgi:hypothetical protein